MVTSFSALEVMAASKIPIHRFRAVDKHGHGSVIGRAHAALLGAEVASQRRRCYT